MPAAQRSVKRETLEQRASDARASLARCTMCERRCEADRLRGERAPCGLGAETWSFKRHVSFGEELELIPSYMVYLGGCNFRCRFCVQGPTCFSPAVGAKVVAESMAAECSAMLERGVRTINLLGGEPSLHVHTILEIAAAAPGPLPLVLNSNMYMTPEVLEMLDGVVTMYVADFKFGNDDCGQRIAGMSRYMEVVTRNLQAAARQSEMIVRHLLMPGHFDCCFIPVVEWLAAHIPDVRFSLMTGYVPAWRAAGDRGELGRTTSEAEVARARDRVACLGLRESTSDV